MTAMNELQEAVDTGAALRAMEAVVGTAVKPEVTPVKTEPRREAGLNEAGDGRALRPGSLLDIRV